MSSNLSQFIKILKKELSESQIIRTGSFEVIDPRDRLLNKSEICIKPKNTKEISLILKLAYKFMVPIIPLGGSTGLVGGQIASQNNQVTLSLEKLNEIKFLKKSNLLKVQSGAILSNVKNIALNHGRHFPLALASEGSCQIGGNLATNAGGLNVIKYGNVRDLCLGLEAVLPSGKILSSMKSLKKNNMGFDLKSLLIGSEGTLGIITSAILKTFPIPKNPISIFFSVNNLKDVLFIFEKISNDFQERILAFELIKITGIELIKETGFFINNPFSKKTNWMVLMEVDINLGSISLKEILEQVLYDLILKKRIVEVFFANTINQRDEFWKIRELIPAANRKKGSICSNDISVPIETIPEFVTKLDKSISLFSKDFLVNCFGHVGDGNLHYNIFPVSENTRANLEKKRLQLLNIVNDLVHKYSGSISAEHGIGRLKVSELNKFEDPGKVYMMRLIKSVVDPKNLLNPGVIF
ncbi:MAG: FAD-binding oxidoreductase [Paracoccaceae bacterium]